MWPVCPAGCPVGGGLHEKTRTRTKDAVASCNGTECEGHEFEKRHCSREEEVLEMHSELLKTHSGLLEKHETCQQEVDKLKDVID